MFGLTGPDLAFVGFLFIALFVLFLSIVYVYKEHKRGNQHVKDFKSIWRLMKPW